MSNKASIGIRIGLCLCALVFVCRILPVGAGQPDGAKQKAMQQLEGAMAEALSSSGKTASVDVFQLDEDPQRAQPGDVARVAYTTMTEEGQIVKTTLSQVALDPGREKAAWFDSSDTSGPEEVVAGEKTGFLNLGEAIIGMGVGEKIRKTIPQENAFGPSDAQKVVRLPCERRMPVTIEIGPLDYVKNQQSFPVAGSAIQLVPYFKSKVLAVNEHTATVQHLATDGEMLTEPFGRTHLRVTDSEIIITLVPQIGATFEVQGKPGRITMTDGQTFTVDLNHPMAGKAVVLDLEIISLVKSSQIGNLEWLDNYNQGLEAAASTDKPVFLLLYAEWCDWCKKLMSQSLMNPGIRILKDEFIWLKIDSDKENQFAEVYEQTEFPLIVLLNAKGDVIKTIGGYRDAAALKRELVKVLS